MVRSRPPPAWGPSPARAAQGCRPSAGGVTESQAPGSHREKGWWGRGSLLCASIPSFMGSPPESPVPLSPKSLLPPSRPPASRMRLSLRPVWPAPCRAGELSKEKQLSRDHTQGHSFLLLSLCFGLLSGHTRSFLKASPQSEITTTSSPLRILGGRALAGAWRAVLFCICLAPATILNTRFGGLQCDLNSSMFLFFLDLPACLSPPKALSHLL